MMVSDVIKLQQVVMFQQVMLRLYSSGEVKLPKQPDLFMKHSDIPTDCSASEKLLYFYFMENKTLKVSLESFMDRNLSNIDLVALSIYSKYFPRSKELEELIETYVEILDDERWYE